MSIHFVPSRKARACPPTFMTQTAGHHSFLFLFMFDSGLGVLFFMIPWFRGIHYPASCRQIHAMVSKFDVLEGSVALASPPQGSVSVMLFMPSTSAFRPPYGSFLFYHPLRHLLLSVPSFFQSTF